MKKPAVIFSIGMISGLLLGGTLVWVQMEQIRDITSGFTSTIDKLVAKLEQKEKNKEASHATIDNKEENDNNKNGNRSTEKKTVKRNKLRLENENLSEVADSTVEQTSDSLIMNLSALTKEAVVATDEIVVRKDERISVHTVSVYRLPDTISVAMMDSLEYLSKLSKTAFEVELWVSPLRYKGYKFVRNQLVLYGIENIENAPLLVFNDALYLKEGGRIYRLDPTPQFSRFKQEEDTYALTYLKSWK